ncbi:hypothetical protein C8J57DRAFT_1090241, partial [Mycena rebaudengoi]
FLDTVLEWLIITDQLVVALEHPKFKTMINIAAHVTNGVKIPGRNLTCTKIMKLSHDQMDKLRMCLQV